MRAALLLAALPIFAGCLGADAPGTTEPLSAGLDEPVVPVPLPETNVSKLAAPAWSAGDAWEARGVPAGGPAEPFRLVVASAGGSGYVTAADSETIALYDALFDVSYVGDVGKDLSGSQQGSPVRFYDWPLEDGKTWTTTWDGFDVALVATRQVSGGGFDVVGTVDGAPYVSYDYDPELRWFSHLDFEGYSVFLDKRVENFTGQFVSASATTLLTLAPAGPGAGTPAGTFRVGEGQTLVAMAVVSATAHHARGLLLFGPDHQPVIAEGVEQARVSPNGGAEFGVFRLPPAPGEWAVLAPDAHDPEGFSLISFSEVLMERRSAS